MNVLRFEKWQGLGNDFVVIRNIDLAVDEELVRNLCDRRFGIGADGVLLVDDHGALPRMIVRNADGSRPEMCGNGLRCVAAHLVQGTDRTRLTVMTDAGERVCLVRPPSVPGDAFDVTIDMGPARITGAIEATDGPSTYHFTTVDVGNPHAVTFEPASQATIERVGPAVAVRPPFGTNVEFCCELSGKIGVTVWERGVGRTLACGTGACAVAAVACASGRATFDAPVAVELPGGILEVTIAQATGLARMRGPSQRVFAGEASLRRF